jgi:hypothetical protein
VSGKKKASTFGMATVDWKMKFEEMRQKDASTHFYAPEQDSGESSEGPENEDSVDPENESLESEDPDDIAQHRWEFMLGDENDSESSEDELDKVRHRDGTKTPESLLRSLLDWNTINLPQW